MDELDLWQRALSPAEIHAIYAAASAGKYSTNSLYPNYQVAIDGISTNIVIISNFAGAWQPETSSFIATNTQTIIELAGNTLGVLLDDIQVVALPFTNYNNYYLPEEPIEPVYRRKSARLLDAERLGHAPGFVATDQWSVLGWTCR